MHLVIPTHPYFFWVVSHPSRTLPPKESEQEPQNRLSLLSTARPYPLLPLTHDPPLLYWLGTGWWCLGFARAPLMCTSKVCSLLMRLSWSEGSSVHSATHPWLLMAWTIFWFPILYGLLPLGAGLCLIVGFSFFSLLFCSFRSLATIPAVPLCHSCCVMLFDPCLLGLFHWIYTYVTLGFLVPLHCLWAPLSHFLLLGHPRPIF